MRLMYRYKLNENAKQDEMKIADFHITKHWKMVYSKPLKLDPFIRTKENPDGIVDYEKLNIDDNNRIVESSYRLFVEDITMYTREELSILSRQALKQIADPYKIDCGKYNDVFIIRKILEKQTEYQELQKRIREEKEEKENEQKRLSEIAKQISKTGEDLEFIC